jgi:hypothetical protein
LGAFSVRCVFGLVGSLAVVWTVLAAPAHAQTKQQGAIKVGDGDFLLYPGNEAADRVMRSDEHKGRCKAVADHSYLRVKSQTIRRGSMIVVQPDSSASFLPGGERRNFTFVCRLENIGIRAPEQSHTFSCTSFSARSGMKSLKAVGTVRVVSHNEITITTQSDTESYVRCPR